MPSRKSELPEGTDHIINGAMETQSTAEFESGSGENAGSGFVASAGLDDTGGTSGGGKVMVQRGRTSKASDGGVVDQLRSQATTLRDQAGGRVREFAEGGKARTTDALDELSKVVSDAAESIDQRLGGDYGEYARKASDAVASFKGTEPAERAKLELIRDEHLRRTQDEEKRYQIAKDLSDNLTISYHTSEVIMARLMQTTSAKERVYGQAVSFFSTNDSVLAALKASFTGMFGLHESTQTLEVMKEGVSKSLEALAEIGDQVGEAAVRAGYGPTIRADAVKKLVESVITFQERSLEIVAEMRKLSTQNSAEIRDAVEEGKRRLARLVAEGQALPVDG